MIVELILSMIFLWSIWSMKTYLEKRKLPPGPFPLPFIGNTLQMLSDPKNPFSKLVKKYGDIFTFYHTAGVVVVLNNARLIREARVGKKDDLSGRSPEYMYPFTEISGTDDVILSDYSTAYLFRRKVFKSAMHVFGSGIEKVEDRARQAVEKAIEEIDRKHGQPFCPKEPLERAILVQIWEWLSSKTEPLNGPTIHTLRKHLETITDIGYQSPLYHLFPFLRYFPTQFRRNIKRAQETVQSIFIPEFQAHQKTYTPGVVRDLTDSFIVAYEKEFARETGKKIGSIEDIPNLMTNVLLGGSGTTSASIAWLILYMALHEDIQQNIHDEIDKIIGNERLPHLQDAPNMPYLQSTLCEIQRISGVLVSSSSNATRDILIDEYKIPKGTLVLINLKHAHLDEREWPEPNEFKPERFLDSDGKFVGWTKLHGFIPFGLGRRECPGSSLAKIMMFTFAATLLHRYKFELPKGSEIPSTEAYFVSAVVKPKDYEVMAKPRF